MTTSSSSSNTHTLTFSRLRASFTVDKELIGKQDPYVIFSSGSAKAQTKAIKNVGTGTAEWKETYSLEKFSPSSSSVIEVTVYNHNTLRPDTVIGAGTVDLSRQGENSLSGSGEPVSIVLTDKKGQETGTISFNINGGGYRGSSSGSGTGTNTSGYATGAGVGSGIGSGSGSSGYNNSGSKTSGQVIGQGYGTDKATAQQASDAAAAAGHTVTIEEKGRLGVGHPKTTGVSETSASRSTTDIESSRTSAIDTNRTSGTVVASGASAGDRAIYGEREGDIIDRKYYVGTESRPQDQALVEQYREHNPYAKDYETTVQHTGRERLINSQIEALGTRERLIAQDHHVHAHPHTEIARNLPAGALSERPGGEGWIQTKVGPICDTNTFSITGDRTVDKERVTDLREHREFEKEFEVKTRLVGERALARGTEAEILNRERVLVDEKDKIACEGHPVASATDGNTIASQTGQSGYQATGATGYTGSGVGSGTGYNTGSGTNYNTGSNTGSGTNYNTGSGTNYNTGSNTGSGYNTGSNTGSGYNTGSGTGSGQSLGQRAAEYIPGSQENQASKGTSSASQGGKPTTGEKVASYIPGTEENREKKQAQYN